MENKITKQNVLDAIWSMYPKASEAVIQYVFDGLTENCPRETVLLRNRIETLVARGTVAGNNN